MRVRVVLEDTQHGTMEDLVIEDPEIDAHREENGSLVITVGAPMLKQHPRAAGQMLKTWPKRVVVDGGQWIWYSIEED